MALDALDLEAAIQQLITLGESDPLDIARKIITRNDKHWLSAQLSAYAEDVISEMARRRLTATRRGREIALRPGDQKASSELKISKMWIPNVGWKKAGDLSAADLRARAKFYDVVSFAASRRSQWCLEVADMIESEGVPTLGKLKAALPSLPELEELEAA